MRTAETAKSDALAKHKEAINKSHRYGTQTGIETRISNIDASSSERLESHGSDAEGQVRRTARLITIAIVSSHVPYEA